MIDVMEVMERIIERLQLTGEFRKVEVYNGDTEDLQKGLTTAAVYLVYNGAELVSEAGANSVKSIVSVRLSAYLVVKTQKMNTAKAIKTKDMLKVMRQALHGFEFNDRILLWQRESAVSIENRTYIYEQEYMYKDYLVVSS